MEAAIEDCLRRLHDYLGGLNFALEIQRAQKEFYQRIGAPLPGEPIMEARLTSFTEWFAFDRLLEGTGRTPVEEYMRCHAEELTGESLEVFRGFTRTVHSVFQVRRREAGVCDLVDLYTLEKYPRARRVPPTLDKDDVSELRIVPANGVWHATDAFCFHPYFARKTILKMMKQARKDGQPLTPLLERLMVMNTRYERYPKTAKEKAYLDKT